MNNLIIPKYFNKNSCINGTIISSLILDLYKENKNIQNLVKEII